MLNKTGGFVWLDLETTGLKPQYNDIVEVGVILTTPELVEIERYQSVISLSRERWQRADDYVLKMHTNSGLWQQSISKDAPTLDRVYGELISFLGRNIVPDTNWYLAGNSVHFDKWFLAEHLGQVLSFVSHRVMDVSTFKILASIWGIEQPTKSVPAHRAIDDLEYSIKEFNHWRKKMFKDGVGPAIPPEKLVIDAVTNKW